MAEIPPCWLRKSLNKEEKKPDPFDRARNARYFESKTLYHIASRTFEGFFLLNPDRAGELRKIIAGVIGRARETYRGIRVHAAAFLSNHFHLAISGDHRQIADFVRFMKTEIARRWGPQIGWRSMFAEGYAATAILTPAGQRRCLRYILSQGVKEGLVDRPEQWPGFHCAASLVTGEPIEGYWFNATDYGTAQRRERRKRNPAPVYRDTYVKPQRACFDQLPALSHLSDRAYRAEMVALVEEVVAEGRRERNGEEPLGVEAIFAKDRMTRSELPPPPWFEDRRRMVVWDDLRAPEVQAYLERYWIFQTEFRTAADRWRKGELDVEFPPGSFRPGLTRPIPHLEGIAD